MNPGTWFPTANDTDVTGWTIATAAYGADAGYATAAPAASATVSSFYRAYGGDNWVKTGDICASFVVEIGCRGNAGTPQYWIGFQAYLGGTATGTLYRLITGSAAATIYRATYAIAKLSDLYDGTLKIWVGAMKGISTRKGSLFLDYVAVRVPYFLDVTTQNIGVGRNSPSNVQIEQSNQSFINPSQFRTLSGAITQNSQSLISSSLFGILNGANVTYNGVLSLTAMGAANPVAIQTLLDTLGITSAAKDSEVSVQTMLSIMEVVNAVLVQHDTSSLVEFLESLNIPTTSVIDFVGGNAYDGTLSLESVTEFILSNIQNYDESLSIKSSSQVSFSKFVHYQGKPTKVDNSIEKNLGVICKNLPQKDIPQFVQQVVE